MPDGISVPTLWTDLAATPLSIYLREASWAYPILETVHIVGIALVFGLVLAYDLRILGNSRSLSVDALGRHLLPWVWTGFIVNAASGTLLFVSNPVEFAINPALQAKMGLIALAGLNAAYFHWRATPAAANWRMDADAPVSARVSAAISITLWLAVIIAGRMMAYVV